MEGSFIASGSDRLNAVGLQHPVPAGAACCGSRERRAESFEEFVRARAPTLLRAAYLLTGDRHAAEDLVQISLAKTHLAWRRLKSPENAEAYVRKTMYHQQVSWWRRRRPLEVELDRLPQRWAPAGDGGDAHEATAIRLVLREALLRLTVRQRAVLVLRFFEDLTEAETARLLGCTTGTVKSQTAKALKRLRAVAPELVELRKGERSPS